VFGRPGDDGELPVEREQLGVVLAGDGDGAPAAVHLWRRIVEGLGIDPGAVELAQDDPGSRALLAGTEGFGCQPTRTAVARATAPDEAIGTIGTIGEVDPDVAAAYDLGARRVGWLVLDTERLFALRRRDGRPPALSRFPSSDIDLSFTLDESVPAARLEFVLRAAAGEYCEGVRLVDVFLGTALGPGSRSLTYRIRFVAPDRTLTDADVAAARLRCIGAAEAELGAELRG